MRGKKLPVGAIVGLALAGCGSTQIQTPPSHTKHTVTTTTVLTKPKPRAPSDQQ